MHTTPIQLQKLPPDDLLILGTLLIKAIKKDVNYIKQHRASDNARIICKNEDAKAAVMKYLRGRGIQYLYLLLILILSITHCRNEGRI